MNWVPANRRACAYRLLLALLLLAGLLLRYAGLDEPVQFHPDERNIALWMDRVHATGSLRPQTYAGGFFVLADAARTTTEFLVQHGSHRWAYFTGTADQPCAPPLDPVVFGRHFNVWLGTLAILLVAGLVRRLAGSRAAALVAAALLAFAAFPIEHAHYLESDMAMLATLLFALWALARFLATRRIRDWISAAILAGFAAGTKFPLTVLVLPLVASMRSPPAHPRPVRRIALLSALAAGGALLGFVAATPDALHLQEFRAGLAKAGAAVFAETAEILGPAAGEPFARQSMNAANLARFAGTLRPGWLLLAALGLPLCCARRYRPYWPVAVLFPAMLLAYVVFLAPWSRSQEFMALLPNLAAWAALPVAALWASRARAAKTAALALAAAAVWPVAQTGVAVSSQFAWEDTRRLANRALAACFPPDQALAAELYAAPAEADLAARTWSLAEFAAETNRVWNAPAAPDYLLFNADFHGRGLRDPRTLAYFPPFADNVAAFRAQGQLVAAWGALDSPAPQPYFRAPRIELWHRRAGALPAIADLGVDLPRPTRVVDEGRTTFFRGDLRAGPRTALLIDRFQREIALAGPGRLEQPVFLVFSTRERAATLRAAGFGRTRRLALGPHDAGAIALERPWWRPRWSRYERVAVRAESADPTLTYLPCFLRVAFDPVEAAGLLLDEGHPDRAVALLRRHGALAAAGPFWRALAGESAAAAEAQALLERWEGWLARGDADLPPARIGALPLALWQDFARLRLTRPDEPLRLQLNPSATAAPQRRSAPLAWILPVPGTTQRLALALGRHPDVYGRTKFSRRVFLDADERTEFAEFAFADLPAPGQGEWRWEKTSADWPRTFVPTFRAGSGGAVRVADGEFTWSWRDMLAVRAAQLRRALAAPPAPAAFRYGAWLALVDGRRADGHAVLTFAALQDFVPPLAVELRIRRRGKWIPGAAAPFGAHGAAWRRGELQTVRLPLADVVAPEHVGLAVRTDVRYHPAPLPCAGTPARRPFPVLADLPARP
ncbi:MAG: glycosyltransferase family 39 protein [Kiritimatiellia bacterium]